MSSAGNRPVETAVSPLGVMRASAQPSAPGDARSSTRPEAMSGRMESEAVRTKHWVPTS